MFITRLVLLSFCWHQTPPHSTPALPPISLHLFGSLFGQKGRQHFMWFYSILWNFLRWENGYMAAGAKGRGMWTPIINGNLLPMASLSSSSSALKQTLLCSVHRRGHQLNGGCNTRKYKLTHWHPAAAASISHGRPNNSNTCLITHLTLPSLRLASISPFWVILWAPWASEAWCLFLGLGWLVSKLWAHYYGV